MFNSKLKVFLQIIAPLIYHSTRFSLREYDYIENMEKFDVDTSVNFNGCYNKLKSSLVHNGPLEGGHYFAVCRYAEIFYKFDDSKVSEISGNFLIDSLGCTYLIYELVKKIKIK